MSEDRELTKGLSFFSSDPKLLLERASGRSDHYTKAKSFVEHFHMDDRYYAINLYEERLPLVIAKATRRDHEYSRVVYDESKIVYNLFVKEDPGFFIETLSDLEYLEEFCQYFGFEYEIYQT